MRSKKRDQSQQELITQNEEIETSDVESEYEEPKKKKKGRKFLTVLFTLLLVVLAGIVAQNALVRPPELAEITISSDKAKTEEPSSSGSKVDSNRKEGVYTFLIVGMDKVADNTDTIMVGKMDTKEKTVSIINIPRDTYVDVTTAIKKINSLYPYAEAAGRDGIKALRKGIEKITGFPIDSYAFIDIEAAAKIVDIIGGVDYNVPVDMFYDDPAQDLHIAISKGMQHLDGDNFVKVMRFRNTYTYGDLQRITVQQDLLSTLASELLSAGNIKNIDDLLDVYEEYVDTNLTKNNLYFYLEQFLLMDEEDISFQTLPVTAAMVDELSYVFINEEEWMQVLNEKLNPYKKDIEASDLTIISSESMGITIPTLTEDDNSSEDSA